MDSLMAMRLVDTHCHLNFKEYDADRLPVLEHALEAGVFRLVIPGIDVATSQFAINYSHQFPGVYSAVGVHPNSGVTWSSGTLPELKVLAGSEKVVAIGEIGLDYYRDFTPRNIQRDIFIQQLDFAAEFGLPVIVHNRDASQDIVDILKSWQAGLVSSGSPLAAHPGVLHSFSASVDVATLMIGLNYKIGITGPVTFHNAQQLQSVVVAFPLEAMLLETDAPYLTPHPFRGKRNEPANVRIVAEKISELKACPVELVAEKTTQSAGQLFDWRDIS